MPDDVYESGEAGRQALETLRTMMNDESTTDAARVAAARALFDRLTPGKEDAEAERRRSEERQAAIAEARCLLAEFAVAKSAGVYEPSALAQDGAADADNAGGGA